MNGPAWRSPKVPFVPEVVRNALLESRVKTTSLSIVYRSSEDICILVPPSGNCVHRDGTCHVHWYVTDAHDISVSGNKLYASGEFYQIDRVSCLCNEFPPLVIRGDTSRKQGTYVVVGEDTLDHTGKVVKRTIRRVVVTLNASLQKVANIIRNGCR